MCANPTGRQLFFNQFKVGRRTGLLGEKFDQYDLFQPMGVYGTASSCCCVRARVCLIDTNKADRMTEQKEIYQLLVISFFLFWCVIQSRLEIAFFLFMQLGNSNWSRRSGKISRKRPGWASGWRRCETRTSGYWTRSDTAGTMWKTCGIHLELQIWRDAVEMESAPATWESYRVAWNYRSQDLPLLFTTGKMNERI